MKNLDIEDDDVMNKELYIKFNYYNKLVLNKKIKYYIKKYNMLNKSKVENEINNDADKIVEWFNKEFNNKDIIAILYEENYSRDLSKDEVYMKYNSTIQYKKLYNEANCSNFTINKDGIIIDVDGTMCFDAKSGIVHDLDNILINNHILEIKNILKNVDLKPYYTNTNINELIELCEKEIKLKYYFFKIVMYKILIKDFNDLGYARALAFSKIFDFDYKSIDKLFDDIYKYNKKMHKRKIKR